MKRIATFIIALVLSVAAWSQATEKPHIAYWESHDETFYFMYGQGDTTDPDNHGYVMQGFCGQQGAQLYVILDSVHEGCLDPESCSNYSFTIRCYSQLTGDLFFLQIDEYCATFYRCGNINAEYSEQQSYHKMILPRFRGDMTECYSQECAERVIEEELGQPIAK